VQAIPESHLDLLDGEVATLATVGADGRPQLTAVWFLVEDGRIRLSLNSARQKVKNLLRNRHCALFIPDFANPYRYLELRGDATIEPDQDYEFADRLGAKYETDLRSRDLPGQSRVVVTLEPVSVYAFKRPD
jgi:PPOX class probable F420-dependent enzyme